MNIRALTATLTLTALLLPAASFATEVYKSVDADGNVVFSQQPPRDTKSEVIKPRYAKQPTAALPAAPDSAAPAPPAAAPPAELTAEQKAAKQKNCDIAKERITQLQGPRANRLQYVNDQQELAYLTPELLEGRIKDAQDKIKQNCE